MSRYRPSSVHLETGRLDARNSEEIGAASERDIHAKGSSGVCWNPFHSFHPARANSAEAVLLAFACSWGSIAFDYPLMLPSPTRTSQPGVHGLWGLGTCQLDVRVSAHAHFRYRIALLATLCGTGPWGWKERKAFRRPGHANRGGRHRHPGHANCDGRHRRSGHASRHGHHRRPGHAASRDGHHRRRCRATSDASRRATGTRYSNTSASPRPISTHWDTIPNTEHPTTKG